MIEAIDFISRNRMPGTFIQDHHGLLGDFHPRILRGKAVADKYAQSLSRDDH